MTTKISDVIQRIIPGADLSTEALAIMNIEACKVLIDSGSVPKNAYVDEFMHFYNVIWAEHLEATAAKG